MDIYGATPSMYIVSIDRRDEILRLANLSS